MRFCLQHPSSLLGFPEYICGRINARIRNKIHAAAGVDHRFYHYPESIRSKANLIALPRRLEENWLDSLPHTGWAPGNGTDLKSWPVPLATYSVRFGDLSWNRAEADRENTFSLHRFGWLLRWLSLQPSADCCVTADGIILDWITKVSPRLNEPAWETYSSSERVVNWLLYLCATGTYRKPDSALSGAIAAALLQHLDYIIRHLEYHTGLCNNHILNNARALYLGGRLLHLPPVAALGRELFYRHLPELINENGSLMEGSSHYQMLLTRTVIEVFWVALMTGDAEFAGHIRDTSESMLSCCKYLTGKGERWLPGDFPLVGDVSPDYPVSWFSPVPPDSDGKETWWKLWGDSEQSLIQGDILVTREPEEWKWIAGADNGFKVLLATPSSYADYPIGHGHFDFGGFLLYDRQYPLIVDRGRYSYGQDGTDVYGYTAEAHNTTLINGLPLIPETKGIWKGYDAYVREWVEIRQSDKKILWTSKAIERICRSSAWQRELSVEQGNIEMLETIKNPTGKKLTAETYFHFAPECRIMRPEGNFRGAEGSFLIERKGSKYCFETALSVGTLRIEFFKGDPESPCGWHFPDYGRKIPAWTILIASEVSGDVTLRIKLTRQ